jgi:hypothetical protein
MKDTFICGYFKMYMNIRYLQQLVFFELKRGLLPGTKL